MSIKKIIAGADEILPLTTLEKKLAKNEPLIIKLGADPTSPNIHLGHVVVLEKLKDFQLLGHNIIFLIGDFTARIGDPTGKSKTRPTLNEDQIINNIRTYVNQISRILDISKMQIVYNSSWFNSFSSQEWIKLTSNATLAQIIQREDFSNRFQNNIPIGIHELIYPLLQGYDSVMLKADIEIGGTDQKFNMLMGRYLQEKYEQEGQVIITMPIIEGLDGFQKMSKSLQNDIGLTEEPLNAYLKIMSINDSLMIKYYKILLRYTEEEVNILINKKGHIETKKELGKIIIEKYWSNTDAEKAYNYFSQVIQNKQHDPNLLNKLIINSNISYNIIDLVLSADKILSKSAIRRLIYAGAISINNEKIIDEKYLYINKTNQDILKIGKQKLFVIINNENN